MQWNISLSARRRVNEKATVVMTSQHVISKFWQLPVLPLQTTTCFVRRMRSAWRHMQSNVAAWRHIWQQTTSGRRRCLSLTEHVSVTLSARCDVTDATAIKPRLQRSSLTHMQATSASVERVHRWRHTWRCETDSIQTRPFVKLKDFLVNVRTKEWLTFNTWPSQTADACECDVRMSV